MGHSEKLKELETKYQVRNIKFKNLELWPVLRYYFCAKYTAGSTSKKINSKFVLQMLKSSFFGFKNLFKKSDYLLISSSDQRLDINGKMIDKSVDFISEQFHNSLLLEIPQPKHYNSEITPSKCIISKLPYYFLTLLVSKFINLNNKISNENLIIEVIKDLGIEINYSRIVKTFIAQYYVTKWFQKWKKFKSVFIVCHYTNMGLIRAFKELNVPVIEIQHGLIAKRHCAYNITVKNDNLCYPDYLLTFGEKEKKTFDKLNWFIDPVNVIPVGQFYLDFISKEYTGDEKLINITKQFHTTISITSQNHPIESKLIEFIRQVSKLNSEILYIFIPRTYSRSLEEYGFPDNVILADWLNVYEIIWHSNIHSTVFSTCALEAPSLGVRNILINIDNLSKLMFEDVLIKSEINKYIETPNEFIEEAERTTNLTREEVINLNSYIIKPNYTKNIKKFIDQKNIKS